jgi:hypothetical protein
VKYLVSLGDLEPRQYDEVVALLHKNRIQCKEIPSGMFSVGWIMVADEQFAAAKRILRDEAREFANGAREEWERTWQEEHGASWLRWFFLRARRNPLGTLIQLLLLGLMVGLFVVLPAWYVTRTLA